MNCCVVIPVYREDPTGTELQSVRRTFSVFAGRDIVYLAPGGMSLERWPQPRHCSVLEAPGYFFTGKKSYSELCCRAELYEQLLQYDYMLICQPDCWVFRDDLDAFMALGHDYIGAPWPAGVAGLKEGVGNGGLSLRRVLSFRDVCLNADTPQKRPFHHPEDRFFCQICADQLDIAPLEVAARFSLEHHADSYYERYGLPMGCHRPWDCCADFWRPILKLYGYGD